MGNFVYRALFNDDIKDGIKCKNPNSNYSLLDFLQLGSTSKTQFISTTKRISVAGEKYSPGKKQNYNNENKRRSQVVLIDLDKVNERIYNCSTEEKLKELKDELSETVSSKEWSQILGKGVGDREIIVENNIPVEAFRVIPPILVDVIVAIEHSNPNCKCIDTINEMIMNNNLEGLIGAINAIEVDEVQENFKNAYYDEMLSMHTYGRILDKSMTGNQSNISGFEVANSIKKSFIEKILNDPRVREIIENTNEKIIDNLDEKFIPEGTFTTTHFKEIDRNNYVNKKEISLFHRICDTFGISLKNQPNYVLTIPSKYDLKKNEDNENEYVIKIKHKRLIKEKQKNKPEFFGDAYKVQEFDKEIIIDIKKLQENTLDIINSKKKKRGKKDCEGVQSIKESSTKRMTDMTNENIKPKKKSIENSPKGDENIGTEPDDDL